MQRLAGEQRQAFDPLAQISLWKAGLLALLPGLLTTALALALVAVLREPSLGVLVLSTVIPVVASALLLGYLLVQGRRRNGTYSLRGVVGNLERTPVWDHLWRIVVLLPTVYAVWWKRDIRIAILVHCTQNSIFNLGPLLF